MSVHDLTPEDDNTLDTAPAADESPETRIALLEQQLREAQERVLRNQAEMENSRRRMRRDMEEDRRYAAQPLLADLLPVVDNILRAVEAAEKTDPESGLLQGVRMVAGLLEDVLAKHHCPRIQAQGQEFDPSQHEAIAQQPSDNVPAGKVLFVAQQGYKLHDRILRPAQVIVSAGPAPRS